MKKRSPAKSDSDGPLCTPDEIRQAAARCWARFLDAYVRGDALALFPWRLRVRLRPALGRVSVETMARSVSTLREQSKEVLGHGYTVQYVRRRSLQMGENDFPAAITVETPEDLLRLSGRREEFRRIATVLQAVRTAFPQLEAWLQRRARTLSLMADDVVPLIQVADFFVRNPVPDVYLRQLPVAADSKFIERHERTLIEWLDELLPPSAIRVDENSFARRYGLRDGLTHHLLRVLDSGLQSEMQLPVDELSLPLRFLEGLSPQAITVFIVENRTNLLTLPVASRALALGGMGYAVTRLRDVPWLATNRVVYWGDLDVDGFCILSHLRRIFPHVESFLMDRVDLDRFAHLGVAGNGRQMGALHGLTPAENAALLRCSGENLRLEQERMPQDYVEHRFANLACRTESTD